MVDSGIILLKYWLEVSPDEQTRRLEARVDDGRKIWKLSPMDLKSYSRWDDYSKARDDMFAATDTAWAPWFVARSDDKKARAAQHHLAPPVAHSVRGAAAREGQAAQTQDAPQPRVANGQDRSRRSTEAGAAGGTGPDGRLGDVASKGQYMKRFEVAFPDPPRRRARVAGACADVSACAQAPSSASSSAASGKSFSQEELDQLLAPIALYPDALLAQVLMASTYPLEVVSAERWVKANAALKDKALQDALQQQTWDPSVKSLAVFPQVLTMMSEKIDWTQKLGDAFLAQQKEVLATAQALRAKAAAQGTLKDSNEQKVTTDATGGTTVISIEPTNPEVVYVPTYNPTVVYGAWPYPAYPPYYYYPPGYVAGGALLGFTAGIIVGARPLGKLQLGRRQCERQRQPLQQLQPNQYLERQLEPQRCTSRRGALPRQGRCATVRPRPGGRRCIARRVSRTRRCRARLDPARRGAVAGRPAGRDYGGGDRARAAGRRSIPAAAHRPATTAAAVHRA